MKGGWLAAFYEEIHPYFTELAKVQLSVHLNLLYIQGLFADLTAREEFCA